MTNIVARIGAFGRRHVLWSLAVGAAVFGVAAFLWWRARAQNLQYVTASVTRGNIQRSVSATGALNPVVTVQVGSYVSGPVKSLGCDYNTEVVVGQVCATIDPVPFQLIVDQDRAQLGTALAQAKKDQAALAYAKLAFERDSKLVAEGTVSQDTADSEKSAYDQALAQTGLDQAAIVDRQAVLKAAQVNLAYTNIVSPVVGTVITRSIDVGQTVAASLQSPTLFIIGKDLTHMQVDTNVSEADVGEVRVGQDVFFTVQAFPGKTFRGKAMQIRRGPITVQNVVTYDVVVEVANPDRSLFPGMTADTHIVIDEHDDVLRVPLPAVRFTPEGVGGARKGPAAKTGDKTGDNTGDKTGERRARTGEGETRERPARTGDGESRKRPARTGEGDSRGGPEGGGGERRAGRRGEHRGQVWVLENGAPRAIAVTMGLDDGALIEVSGEGLKPGDKVIVNQINPGEQPRRNSAGPNQGQVFRQPGQAPVTGPGPGFGPRP